MPAELPDYLGQGERIAASGGTALRFALRRPLAAAARRDDRTWRVRLSADAQAPRPLYPLRLASPARLRLAPGRAAPPGGRARPRHRRAADRLAAAAVRPRATAPELGRDRAAGHRAGPGLAPAQRSRAAAGHRRRRRIRGARRPRPFRAAGQRAERLPAARPRTRSRPAPRRPRARGPAGTDRATRPERSCRGSAAHACRRDRAIGRKRGGRGLSAHARPDQPNRRAQAQLPRLRRTRPSDRPSRTPGPPPIEHRAGAAAEPAAPLGLVGWDLRSGDTAPQRRAALLQALAQAAPDERAARRVELARDYLSRALAAEALGVLGRVDGPEDEAARQARQALRGAAALLMGRIDAAAEALGAAAFNGDPEVALWRAAIAASRQDWPLAARELARSGEVLAAYPQALRLRLGLVAASIAIESGNAELAATVLEQLEGLQLAQGRARPSRVPQRRRQRARRRDRGRRRDLAHARARRTGRCAHPGGVRAHRAVAGGRRAEARGGARPAGGDAHPVARPSVGRAHAAAGWRASRLDAGDRPGALRTWRELLERFPAHRRCAGDQDAHARGADRCRCAPTARPISSRCRRTRCFASSNN